MSARFVVLGVALAITCEGGTPFRDPVWRETALRHSRPLGAGEKFDPQESDPKLRAAFAAADAAAERRVMNVKRDEKFIFRYWSAKKEILRQQFGIEWKTPAELNPRITYSDYGQREITEDEKRDITPVVRKRTSTPITSIERDYEGKVRVWTKPGVGDESIAYVVELQRGRWKIVDVEHWMP
jgi:hypothetical protein